MTGLATTFFDVIFRTLPVTINLFKEAKEVVESYNKKIQDAFAEAEAADRSEISGELRARIAKFSWNKIQQTMLIGRAINTNKLIKYAIYCMIMDKVNPVDSLSKKDKEFINAIAELSGYGKLYEDEDTADIKKYDIARAMDNFDEPYIILYDELYDRVLDPRIVEKWHTKKAKLMLSMYTALEGPSIKPGFTSRIDENGMIHPIFFQNPGYDSERELLAKNQMPETLITKFDNALWNLIPEQHYYSINDDGNYILSIVRPEAYNAEDSYVLDDGRIMGGDNIYILGYFTKDNGMSDTMFVNVARHPVIVRNIVSSPFYQMTHSEVLECLGDFFNNTSIYHYIDFSNTKWLDNITGEDYKLLEKNLGSIIATLNEDVRMRFYSFSNPTDFILVSDAQCVSTMPGITSSHIHDGLAIIMGGDIFSIKTKENPQGKNYKIQ